MPSVAAPPPGGSPPLCREDDEYVRDTVRWVVELDDGQVIYEDDGRPGVTPASAWVRLGDYCKGTGRYITRMRLQFRSHHVNLPSHAPGYWFRKCAFGVWGEGQSYDAYLAGTLEGGTVRVTRWKVPELAEMETESRDADFASPSLIARP